MPKAIKYVLIAFGALIAVLAAVAAYFAATFDPNAYKPLIIKTVLEKKQRTLAIPGNIKLTFFPKIGADLGEVSLSEHGQPSVSFASIRSAKVSLALLPLLSKRVIVDHVSIEGLRATVVKNKDGTMNIDDLTGKDEAAADRKEASAGGDVNLDIDSIDIADADLVYDDREAGRRLELADLNLDTGRIADGAKSKFDLKAKVKSSKPEADVVIDAKSGFLFQLKDKHYVLDGLDAHVAGSAAGFSGLDLKIKGKADLLPDAKRFALDGIAISGSAKAAAENIDFQFDIPKLAATDKDVTGGKVTGKLKLTQGPRTIDADIVMPSFEGTPQSFKIAALNVDAAIKDAEMNAKANINGAFAGNLDQLQLSSPQLKITLDGKSGEHAIGGNLTTPLSVDLKAKSLRLPAISAAFTLPNPGGGVMKLSANGQASADLAKSTLTSAIKGDFDGSGYDIKLGMGSFSPASYNFEVVIDHIDADRYSKKAAAAGGKPMAQAPEQPIDLSALKTLTASGSIKIGAFKIQNLHLANLRADIHAAAGKLDVRSIAASLYGGSVAGSLSAAASAPPRFEIQQTLSGINIGPLLKDAIDKEPIDGKGTVKLDVQAQGATFTALKKGLSGNARLDLKDGAVKGFNIAKALRDAKAKIGVLQGNAQAQSGTSSAEEKTDFSEISASFKIAGGVAHNDDLDLKSPLLRVGGSGDVDIGNERLDYLVKATVVQSLQGQGGPELQALKGLTVPVRLSGPFTSIGWKVDFAGLASSAVKQKVDEKKEEIKNKVKDKLQEQLGDKLKGLFGR